MTMKHVAGNKKGRKVVLYALSTCGWCKKTKELLNVMSVEYDYTDVDLLRGAEQEEAMKVVKKFNPECNFPTMVIDGKLCIVGFREEEIRKALGK
ncbi:MAG: NrdH-redoxin [Chloroflexi bacterium RBG_16_56_11]|nr:MAG: NrdH-redoxin [Chloroflexi bacterium RBG_16_56_11]